MGCHLVKTAVLLTTFNGARFLPDLLDSLLAQTDPDFVVRIQDDGSSDETPALIREICARDSRFSTGNEQNRHFGAAGNFLSLIRQSEDDYILLCDQDDVWEPEKIAVLKEAMADLEAGSAPGTPLLVHSDCSVISEEGEQIEESFFRHQGWDPKAVTLPPLLVQNNVTGCTLMINAPMRKLVSEHARAKELFMHDWFIALTAASFGKIAFVDRPLTRYRQHEKNTVGASARPLLIRGFAALRNRRDAKRRILLTYTHTRVFSRLYNDRLPPDSQAVVDAYLATRRMRKIPRILAVRRLGCLMQSPVTRLGQILFG